MKEIMERIAAEVFEAERHDGRLQIRLDDGALRAALTADEMANEAQFFSFGTNDLTQTTFGISRDDAGAASSSSSSRASCPQNPFQQLDRDGVGKLVDGCQDGLRDAP